MSSGRKVKVPGSIECYNGRQACTKRESGGMAGEAVLVW